MATLTLNEFTWRYENGKRACSIGCSDCINWVYVMAEPKDNVPRKQIAFPKIEFSLFTAILGASAFFLGYIYNIGYFIVLDPMYMGFLSINDYIVSTLIFLPFVLASMLGGIIWGSAAGIFVVIHKNNAANVIRSVLGSTKGPHWLHADSILSYLCIIFGILTFVYVAFEAKFNQLSVIALVLSLGIYSGILMIVIIRHDYRISSMFISLLSMMTALVLGVGASNAHDIMEVKSYVIVHSASNAPTESGLLRLISGGAIVKDVATSQIAFIPNAKIEYITGSQP